MHGVELGFLLLSQFLADGRSYVSKRPRVEKIAADLVCQCRLLTEVVDGELEEEEEERRAMKGGDDGEASAAATASGNRGCRSLTQPFPFPDAPPTTSAAARSPGLARLTAAVRAAAEAAAAAAAAAAASGATSTPPPPASAPPHCLLKLVLNLSAAFASFDRWTVGLGLEPQLDALRAAVGLGPMSGGNGDNGSNGNNNTSANADQNKNSKNKNHQNQRLFLDYNRLVRPELVEKTLTDHVYDNAEDYFFRAVHLGTECWAKVALNRLAGAKRLAEEGRWRAASARCAQAASVLEYLGDHVLLLTTMNLRDYLELKVQIEGTSGEGSAQVRAFRPAVRGLLGPLAAALRQRQRREKGRGDEGDDDDDDAFASASSSLSCASDDYDNSDDDKNPASASANDDASSAAADLQPLLLKAYARPDRHRALYNYCQALEALESALLGGFYYRHYRLAQHVIGSDSRGTMKRAVAALKGTYERAVFPELDACRSELGRQMDAALSSMKGRIMDDILGGYRAGGGGVGSEASGGCPFGRGQAVEMEGQQAQEGRKPGGGCPFARAAAREEEEEAEHAADNNAGTAEAKTTAAALKRLYSWSGVSDPHFRERAASRVRELTLGLGLKPHPRGAGGLSSSDGGNDGASSSSSAAAAAAAAAASAPLSFLSHAWGIVPPRALEQALGDWAALAALGNPAWDVAMGTVVPEAEANVRRLLLGEGGGGDDDGDGSRVLSVQWAHNSHELAYRVLTSRMVAQGGSGDAAPPRLLTSDCEFYSAARQINLLASSSSPSSSSAAAASSSSSLAVLPPVASEPAETFEARLLEAVRASAAEGRPLAAVYASAVTFLTQRLLVRDPAALARSVAEASAEGWQRRWWQRSGGGGKSGDDDGAPLLPPPPAPLVIVDGYHAFCALPIPPLATPAVPDNLVFIAGLLKHAACGPNAAFAALSPTLAARLLPLNSGWLADFGSHVTVKATTAAADADLSPPPALPGFSAGSELAGATPSFVLPLLVFNRACALRGAIENENHGFSSSLSVARVHSRVVALQQRLIDGLPGNGRLLSRSALLPPTGSHTLVFRLPSPQDARACVQALAAKGVMVDCRESCVRVGLGGGHDEADVDALLRAVVVAEAEAKKEGASAE
jgi:tryptophan 2,3-dioxygenase